MKALYITEPGRCEVRDIPRPSPAADEVLLRVRLVGYCGSDLNTFRGRNPLVSLPRVPGHEIAATIAEMGAAVPAGFEPGMNVTLSPYTACGHCPSCRRGRPNACQHNQTLGVQRDGGLTEFIAVPWEKLFHSPALSFTELALVEPLTVGFHAVDRGRVQAGDVVAVLGCGAVGLGAVTGAACRQATVIAVDIDEAKLQVAREAGARHTVNSADGRLHEALRAVCPGGPDVVIEAIGLPETFRAAVEEAAFAGRVVYIGYAREPVTYDTKSFVQKELDILGSRNALGDFRDVIRMLERHAFPIRSVVTRTVPFEQAADALHDWNANPAAVTKILVELGNGAA